MWNRINGYHPDEETLEVDWPCHPPRSFHCKNCYALDARRETQAGSPQDTWRQTVEKEIKEMGKTWEGIKFMARDRQMWREHVAALHAC